MTLADIRDYIASLGLSKCIYMAKLPAKQKETIGVYNSKHQHSYHTALGGVSAEGYGEKYITILIHWNESARETETVAVDLFDKIRTVRDIKINNETIKFIQPLYDLQDIGTDDFGICEMVIEATVIYAKR